jgi:hypothetical protein
MDVLMKGEIYYWIALVAAICIVAVYLRYYYNPAIDVTIKFSPYSQNATYLYQKGLFNLTVINNGADIRHFNVGVYIDGNLSSVYNISLGSGKRTTLQVSHYFTDAGPYNFTAIGDPARLFNVANRQNARSSLDVKVLPPVTPDPEELLPANQTYSYTANRTLLGYVISSYLSDNYSMPVFNISDIGSVNSFLDPLLTIAASYITNMSSAGADYSDGKAFSLWISGSISSSILAPAAEALSLNESNMSLDGSNVTVVDINNDTSVCGWYSQGWLKTLSYQGDSSCFNLLESKMAGESSIPIQNKVPSINGSTEIGNFTTSRNGGQSAGRLFFMGNDSFVYSTISTNSIENNTCYGVIDSFNGVSYCSTYIIPKKSSVGNSSLIRTTAYLGNLNESVFSLVGTSKLESQLGVNIGILNSFGVAGTSKQFVSGLRNTCTLSSGFYCLNANFGSSDLYLNLSNILNVSSTIRSAYCYWNGAPKAIQMDRTVVVGNTLNLTIPCYNYGANITGIPLSLDLNIGLNYTVGNTMYNSSGQAYIIT